MALTSVGAIYGTQSNHLQRIYIPDNDDSEINNQYVGPGESVMLVPISVYQNGGPDAVQAAVGPYDTTVAGRCAIVSNTTLKVIDHIIADTNIYNGATGLNPDGNHVVRHDNTAIGDAWLSTINFTRRYAEITPANGSVVAVSTQNINNAAPANGQNLLVGTIPSHIISNGQVLWSPTKIASFQAALANGSISIVNGVVVTANVSAL
jgi:hypothetical protein